jgi:hypothetical protein
MGRAAAKSEVVDERRAAVLEWGEDSSVGLEDGSAFGGHPSMLREDVHTCRSILPVPRARRSDFGDVVSFMVE